MVVSTLTSERASAPRATAVIDCGVVCNWASRAELYAYLPRDWRDYVPPGQPRFAVVIPSWNNPNGDWRPEARATESGQAASDVGAIAAHALGPDVGKATLLMDE